VQLQVWEAAALEDQEVGLAGMARLIQAAEVEVEYPTVLVAEQADRAQLLCHIKIQFL
jgi:hypothetical protein